jgi:hypothetical protein
VVEFIEGIGGPKASYSTISREYKIFGFTRKVMHYVDLGRDENDRVAYFVNPPTHRTRPGIRGVSAEALVDLVDV